MRRLASVFSKRDKPDSNKSESSPSHPPSTSTLSFKKQLRLPLNLSFISSHPLRTSSPLVSTPLLSSASDHAQSSGSSSGSASLSLPTPDDDSHVTSLSRSATKLSWKDWLGGKRSDPVKLPEAPLSTEWDRPMPGWNKRLSTLQRPQTGSRETDDTDDASSSEYDDYGFASSSEHPRTAPSAASPAMARQNLELLIRNGLASPLPSSPFVHHPGTYLFPRSCNRPRLLPSVVDIRKTVLNQRLLCRLETLPPDSETEILPFGSMSTPVSTQTPALPNHDVVRPLTTARISSASPGLRRWISRSGFEDRFSIFLPSKDGVHKGPIVGSLAVAALEYSETLDVMVDPDFDSSSLPDTSDGTQWTPTFDNSSPNSPPSPITENDVLVCSRESSLNNFDDTSELEMIESTNSRHLYISSPSPLRNQHSPEAPLSQSTLSSPLPTSLPSVLQNGSSLPSSPVVPQQNNLPPRPPVGAPVKRVVRFAEDDNEDAVPLHLLRQRKKKEEKAKFLRTEQRRRLMEQEQERRRLEAETLERERRRLVKESERKESERRLYAEEVAAARLRRETQRVGVIPGLRCDTNTFLAPSPSAISVREPERNRARESKGHSLMPHHSNSSSTPRREASDSAVVITPSSPLHPYSLETSSYRASSHGHSPAASNSGHGHPSRPGSMYSTSSEDGRPSGKRQSMPTSLSSNLIRPFGDRSSFQLSSSSIQSLHSTQPIPPVPPLPAFMNDFVFLPPSAPFMMHQYPRQSSRHSSPGPSNSSGSLRGNSANSSTERVNMKRHPSSRHAETYSAPPSPGSTSPKRSASGPTHSRHGSGDSKRSSMPASPQSYASSPRSQPSSLSRGRSQMPYSPSTQYMHPATPWGALPMQNETQSTVMPPYSNTEDSNRLSKGGPMSGSKRGKGR